MEPYHPKYRANLCRNLWQRLAYYLYTGSNSKQILSLFVIWKYFVLMYMVYHCRLIGYHWTMYTTLRLALYISLTKVWIFEVKRECKQLLYSLYKKYCIWTVWKMCGVRYVYIVFATIWYISSNNLRPIIISAASKKVFDT